MWNSEVLAWADILISNFPFMLHHCKMKQPSVQTLSLLFSGIKAMKYEEPEWKKWSDKNFHLTQVENNQLCPSHFKVVKVYCSCR